MADNWTGVSSLASLPREILDSIISYLSTDQPSLRNLNLRPQPTLTCTGPTPLKDLSSTSKRLRSVAGAYLFRHANIRIEEASRFVEYLARHGWKNSVKSMEIRFEDNARTMHDGDYVDCQAACSNLCRLLPFLSDLILLCPPARFTALTHDHIHDADAWTFNMPYHLIRIRFDYKGARPLAVDRPDATVFEALPWTSLSVNENSFLRAYTQYEYFLRRAPSILVMGHMIPPVPQLPRAFFSRLQFFAYTGIFPFFNHVDAVLSLITHNMPNLRYLTMCLGPHPDEYARVIQQEMEESSGKIDHNDTWMEFETAYELIAYHVRKLGIEAKLEFFKSEDFQYGDVIRGIVQERIGSRLEHSSEETVLNYRPWVDLGTGMWQLPQSDADGDDSGRPTEATQTTPVQIMQTDPVDSCG